MAPKRDNQLNATSHYNSATAANHQHYHPQHQQQQQQQQRKDSVGVTLRGRATLLHAPSNATTTTASATTQQTYQANARLCRMVEKCPWMYDRHHANYAKKTILDKSWEKIAHECGESVASCKERWRNIRAAFARSINIYKTHGGPNRVKPYYLHTELAFLIKPMQEGRDNYKYDDVYGDDDDGAGGKDSKDATSGEVRKELAEQRAANESETDDDVDEGNENNDDNDVEDENNDNDVGDCGDGGDGFGDSESIDDHDLSKHNHVNASFIEGMHTAEEMDELDETVDAAVQCGAQLGGVGCHKAAGVQQQRSTPTVTMPLPQLSQRQPHQEPHYHHLRGHQQQQQQPSHCEATKLPMKCYHSQSFGSDSDGKFLEALLPDLRAMNARQKIIFKRKIYQSIEEVMDIRVNDESPVATPPNSKSAAPQITQVVSGHQSPFTLINRAAAASAGVHAEKMQMLQYIFNMPDEKVQRLNAILQQHEQQHQQVQQQQQQKHHQKTCTTAANQMATRKRGAPLPTPPYIPGKRNGTGAAVNGVVTASGHTSSAARTAMSARANVGAAVEAPWNQIVPIAVKLEDDVDVE